MHGLPHDDFVIRMGQGGAPGCHKSRCSRYPKPRRSCLSCKQVVLDPHDEAVLVATERGGFVHYRTTWP